MTDRREEILQRLLVVVTPLASFARRNAVDLPDNRLPAIIVLDGDETALDDSFGRKRPVVAPIRMVMTPELYIKVRGLPETVGTALNALARQVVKTILTDSLLVELAYDGDIRYEGMSTGLAAGRSIEGEALLTFAFHYVLRPNDI